MVAKPLSFPHAPLTCTPVTSRSSGCRVKSDSHVFVGRVTSRRKDREKPKSKKASRREIADLEQRITDVEAQKRDEKRVHDAIASGEHRKARTTSKRLEVHKAKLDDMYKRWMEQSL